MKAPRVHAEALQLATELGDLLGGHCERIEVVGSLRRRLPVVGDIELLAEPIPSRSFDLFGDPETGGSCPLCLALDAAQKYQSFFPYQPPAGNNEEAGVWDALRAALPRDRAIACLMCMEDV